MIYLGRLLTNHLTIVLDCLYSVHVCHRYRHGGNFAAKISFTLVAGSSDCNRGLLQKIVNFSIFTATDCDSCCKFAASLNEPLAVRQ